MNRRFRWSVIGAALTPLCWSISLAQQPSQVFPVPARVVVSDLPGPPIDGDLEQNIPEVPASETSADDEFVSVATEAAGLADAAGAPPKCDPKKMAALKKSVGTAYKPLFYDNNFSYLYDPCYTDHHFGEDLKRLCILDGALGTMDIGGQYRARYHGENNMRGSGLTGRDDNFLLHRTRLYSNWEISDRFRVYGEMIDAESNYENFTPRAIEVNRADMLNLFADAKLFDGNQGDLFLRYGRQELLFGNQRTVSPLDWANTRRTFEGVKSFWRGKDWDFDAFWVRPVIVDPYRFDNVDDNQEFSGAYASYKGWKDEKLDFYGFRHIKTAGAQPFSNTTLGTAYNGTVDTWVWDHEVAYQFGDFAGNSHQSGFFVVGLGRKFDDQKGKPVFMAYYDWARGDTPPGNAYDQLFPLVHKYNGFMDLFGRRNLEDVNFQLTMKPTDKTTLLLWHHILWRQNTNDVVYNANNTVFNSNVTGGRQLGQELDLLLTYAIQPRHELMLGYSHFWAGDYYKTTPGLPYRNDANFFYTQYQFNF